MQRIIQSASIPATRTNNGVDRSSLLFCFTFTNLACIVLYLVCHRLYVVAAHEPSAHRASIASDTGAQALFHMPDDADALPTLMSPKAAAAAELQEGSEIVISQTPFSRFPLLQHLHILQTHSLPSFPPPSSFHNSGAVRSPRLHSPS